MWSECIAGKTWHEIRDNDITYWRARGAGKIRRSVNYTLVTLYGPHETSPSSGALWECDVFPMMSPVIKSGAGVGSWRSDGWSGRVHPAPRDRTKLHASFLLDALTPWWYLSVNSWSRTCRYACIVSAILEAEAGGQLKSACLKPAWETQNDFVLKTVATNKQTNPPKILNLSSSA